jgi:probable F420-dependent oxidoreductase
MRFGVNILNFGSGTDPASLLSWARFAEDRGFDFAMISDHVAVTPQVAARYPTPFYDPFATLAWLAGQTERIELGTTVAVLPFRHPLQVARLAANIDRFSSGRLILGVGVSWAPDEFTALGVPFERRGALTDEYLEVITRAWGEDPLTYQGPTLSFSEVGTGPTPSRPIPVWVGGASPAALRRAARFADAWHPLNQTVDQLREHGLPALADAAHAAGRPMPALAPRLPLRITEDAVHAQRRPAGTGTLEQVRRDLAELAELGATHILFDTYPGTPDAHRPAAEDQRLLELVASKLLVDHQRG